MKTILLTVLILLSVSLVSAQGEREKLFQLLGEYISKCEADSTLQGEGVVASDSLGTQYIILTPKQIKDLKVRPQRFWKTREPRVSEFIKWLKSKGY